MLAEAEQLATFKLGADAEAFQSWTAEFTCSRDGMLDGLAGESAIDNVPFIAEIVYFSHALIEIARIVGHRILPVKQQDPFAVQRMTHDCRAFRTMQVVTKPAGGKGQPPVAAFHCRQIGTDAK